MDLTYLVGSSLIYKFLLHYVVRYLQVFKLMCSTVHYKVLEHFNVYCLVFAPGTLLDEYPRHSSETTNGTAKIIIIALDKVQLLYIRRNIGLFVKLFSSDGLVFPRGNFSLNREV